MINYDKWKLLNENFLISQPLGGIKSNNGFLAYNKLHEDEEIEEVEEEEEGDEDEYEDEYEDTDDEEEVDVDVDEDEDMDGEGDEDMDGEGDEDEDEGMDDEGDEDEDEDMDGEGDEDEDYEGEDDMDGEGDEGTNLMGRVRSIHHPHAHMHHRPHHEMDSAEIDFAAKAADKMSAMYASCESMDYKLPPMNEWLASVNAQMFPEELQDYIGKSKEVINEEKAPSSDKEEGEEEGRFGLSSKFNQLEARIKQIGEQSGAIQKNEFVQLMADFIKSLKPHVTGKLSGGLEPKLQRLMDAIEDFLPEAKSMKSMGAKYMGNGEKHNKKGCGYSMPMMKKKSKSNCGYMHKGNDHHPRKKMKGCMKSNMKKGWKG